MPALHHSARRRFLVYAGAAAAGLGSAASAIRAQTPLAPTPAMTEGPFYPESFTREPLSQLVRGTLQGNAIMLALEGRILDRFGKPVDGARVEIWQCDGIGHYHHSRDGDAKDRDPNFAGIGWVKTGADGRYAFNTIRPVFYPGRTPHIHFAVKAPRYAQLITQMFVEGEAQNQGDGIYARLSRTQRALVTARLEPAGAGQRAGFDLVLA
jgi:protocatechuate 3,4-dioxygenase beta subunit